MREICPHCDVPMYLSKDSTDDSPHLVWICSTASNPSFDEGTLRIVPNWSLLLSGFELRPEWYEPVKE